jgi:ribosomal-protein-alanine N-acetyltransferase
MRLPQAVHTERMVLRRPRRRDAQAIFDSYASDPLVTRDLTWRTHQSVADTHHFLDQADRGWSTGADSPYVAWMGETLVGATGLTRVGPKRLRTGYLVARRYWGQGLASEMVRAMTALAFEMRLCETVEALAEPANLGSIRVLEKAGFKVDGQATTVHPNLGPEVRTLARYVRVRQEIA